MAVDTNYCYKESKNFIIENGIMKGVEEDVFIWQNGYGDWILEKLKATPDFVGQIHGLTGEKETFGDMADKSVKCAMWLRDQNIQPGDVIGICTNISMDMYIPCFASMYIGAVFNGWWDVGLSKVVIKHFLTMTRPKMVFANEETVNLILEVSTELGFDTRVIVLEKRSNLQSLDDIIDIYESNLVKEFRCSKLPNLDHPLCMIYTSGSTGMPKAVVHSHKNFFANTLAMRIPSEKKMSITSLPLSSIAWISGVLCMFKGVVVPETKIVYPEISDERTFEIIERFKINWTVIPPNVLVKLHKSPAITKFDISSLKFVIVGGSVLNEDTEKSVMKQFPDSQIYHVYGTTELGTLVSRGGPDSKPGSCGKVCPNVSIKVIDTETGKILGPNKKGEAWIKYPTSMSCYYNNPEDTRMTIDSEGWLHTGDLVHYDEEGNIFVTDRIKEMIKYKGHQVSPAMIEQILSSHPGVSEVAVVSKLHENDGEHPVAFVVKTLNYPHNVTAEDLKKMVAESLPDQMRLRGGIIFMNQLPHTSSGKIAKPQLKKIARENSNTTTH